MSRRESRTSLNVRQSDALVEFENFKKKFLLANKHITKLNSTLSVRIEELNAQVSTLYVENLRLRASEIALAAQLKREREKSRKIMSDAETATLNLTKHLEYLRQSFNIAPSNSQAYSPPKQHRTGTARRPVPNPSNSPQATRLSRAPNVPGIFEEDESPEADEDTQRESPSPTLRRKAKTPRLSSSRLPMPSRVVSPPPLPTLPHVDFHEGNTKKPTKRKTSRRQSGLLGVDGSSSDLPVPRPPSPAFGSPVRREAGLAEAEEEVAAINGEVDVDIDVEAELKRAKKEKKGKSRERDRDLESDTPSSESGRARDRERKRAREEEGLAEGSKFKLKDVTNSPQSRADLPLLDTNNTADRDRQRTPDTEPPTSAISSITSSSMAARNFLSTAATTPASTPLPDSAHYPSPRASSSPQPQPGGTSASESEAPSAANGRESRRTRKSVNYAEPKLNTKMRKPDPPPGAVSTSRKRSSAAGSSVMPSSDDGGGRSSLDAPLPSLATAEQQRSSSPRLSGSRPSSTVSTTSTAATSVKRKKSRPYVLPDEDEDDGAQADRESTSRGHGWVNVEGRRRSVQASVASGTPNVHVRRVEEDDGRRHSMAV